MTTFGMKKETRIGYWNVQTLNEPGRLKQLSLEFQRFNLDILGISECRWLGNGELTTNTGEKLIYSCNENHRTEGVGLLLSRDAANALLEWKPISPRIMTARFNSRTRKTTIVQVYAPTEVSDLEKKTEFYNRLEATFASIKKGDIKILMGDLNAQIGCANSNIEHVMGKHGIGNLNENGDMLIDFCNTRRLVIGSSLFPHKRCHKTTWRSPDNTTQNQIDHFCISRTWRNSLFDVRTFNSADIGSDHFLAIARLRMRVMTRPKGNLSGRIRYNVDKLKSPTTKAEFVSCLQNKSSATSIHDDSINEIWSRIKNCFIDTCNTVLRPQRKKKSDWISDLSLDLIERRRAAKINREQAKTRAAKIELDLQYRNIQKQVKQSCRNDKRNWAENLATQAENASRTNNPRILYQITKKLTGKFSNTSRPIKDSKGNMLTNDEDQLKCWHNHFLNILNADPLSLPSLPSHQSSATQDITTYEYHYTTICTSPPSLEEIVQAIKQLKNGKATGIDNIPAEALKANPDTSALVLQPLFNAIWQEEKLPDEWLQGILIKVPKKETCLFVKTTEE